MKNKTLRHQPFSVSRLFFINLALLAGTIPSPGAKNDDPSFWLFTATEQRLNRTQPAIKHVTADETNLTIGGETNGNNNDNAIDLHFSLPFQDKNATVYTLSVIVDGCFNDNSHYTNLAFGAGLRSIGANAFSYTGQKARKEQKFSGSIVLPASLETLGTAAFRSNNLSFVTFLPGALKAIGDSAFEGSGIGGALMLPANIETLGASAFRGSFLSSLSFDGPATFDIGDFATAGCKNLTALSYPASLRSVGVGQLAGCASGLTVDWAAFPSEFLSPRFLEGTSDRASTHLIRRNDAAWSAFAEAFPETFALPAEDGSVDGWWAYNGATQTVRWAETSSSVANHGTICGVRMERDEEGGGTCFVIDAGKAMAGIRYNVFTAPTLTNAFWRAAEANRIAGDGEEGALRFLLATDDGCDACFARIVTTTVDIESDALLGCAPGTAPMIVSPTVAAAADALRNRADAFREDFEQSLSAALPNRRFSVSVTHPATLARDIDIRLRLGTSDIQAAASAMPYALLATVPASISEITTIVTQVTDSLQGRGYMLDSSTDFRDGAELRLVFETPGNECHAMVLFVAP